jgi:hypothetical protein
MMNKAQREREAKLAASLAGHRRHNELVKLLDAMYDREDLYSPAWNNEQFELEVELVALTQRLESEE